MFGSKASPGPQCLERSKLSPALPPKAWVLIKVSEAVGQLREISFCQAVGHSAVWLHTNRESYLEIRAVLVLELFRN